MLESHPLGALGGIFIPLNDRVIKEIEYRVQSQMGHGKTKVSCYGTHGAYVGELYKS